MLRGLSPLKETGRESHPLSQDEPRTGILKKKEKKYTKEQQTERSGGWREQRTGGVNVREKGKRENKDRREKAVV